MKLEVYYDYACPHCLRGHGYLLNALSRHPSVEVEWHPCEAHPRPEPANHYSDLCARGLYILQEQGGDVMRYHEIMYKTALENREVIDDPRALAEQVKELVDPAVFAGALESGKYVEQLAENNRRAWGAYAYDAVPSMRAGDRDLRSIPGVGLTEEMIEAFLVEIAG